MDRKRERQPARRVDPAAAAAAAAARLAPGDDEHRPARPVAHGLTGNVLRGADHVVRLDLDVVPAPPEIGGYLRRVQSGLVSWPG